MLRFLRSNCLPTANGVATFKPSTSIPYRVKIATSSGLSLLRNRGLAAKDILLDLAGGCFRQLGHKLDSLGTLEVRQMITSERGSEGSEWASFRVLTLSPLSVKSMQPYSDPYSLLASHLNRL